MIKRNKSTGKQIPLQPGSLNALAVLAQSETPPPVFSVVFITMAQVITQWIEKVCQNFQVHSTDLSICMRGEKMD